MANPSTDFFSKLKSVCRNIEQGISQLQTEVETKTSSRSAGKAVLKLTSLKQEIQQMKIDGREKCQTLTEEGVQFNELMSCCRSLLDIQNNKLQNIELFLKQYGYKEFKPSQPAKEEEKDEHEDESQDVSEETNEISTPPNKDKKPDRSRTPKPEDFGFSSYTLKAMERGFSNVLQQDFSTTTTSRQELKPHAEARIPSVFNQDEVVSLTPSVFGRHVPFHTPGKYQVDSPCLYDLLTPAEKYKKLEQGNGSDVPKMNLFSGNLEAPVFKTPDFKHLGKKEHLETLPSFSGVKNNVSRSMFESPPLPVFESESARKLTEQSKKDVQSNSSVISSRARLYDEMPQTPELTCNIKFLTQQLKKEPVEVSIEKENRGPTPPVPEFLTKDITDTITSMPREFKPLADHHMTSNETPPMPEMMTERLSKFSSNNHKITDLISRTPPTPKFLSQYMNEKVQNK